MNCKKCGAMLNEIDQFCKNCGEPVQSVGTPNPVMGSVQQPVQPVEAPKPVMESVQQPVQPIEAPKPVMESVQQPVQPVEAANPVMESVQQPVQPVEAPKPVMENVQQPVQPKKSGGFIKYVLIVLVILAAIFAAYMFGNKNTSDNETGGESLTKVTGSYKVNYNNFTFSIPDNLIYEKYSDFLLIGNQEDTWVITLEFCEGSYNKIKENINLLQSTMQKNGYNSSAATLKTVNSVEFVTLEISGDQGSNYIVGYTYANSTNILGFSIMTIDNDYDYSLLETMATIVSSLQYSEATTNIKNYNNFNFNILSDMTK